MSYIYKALTYIYDEKEELSLLILNHFLQGIREYEVPDLDKLDQTNLNGKSKYMENSQQVWIKIFLLIKKESLLISFRKKAYQTNKKFNKLKDNNIKININHEFGQPYINLTTDIQINNEDNEILKMGINHNCPNNYKKRFKNQYFRNRLII